MSKKTFAEQVATWKTDKAEYTLDPSNTVTVLVETNPKQAGKKPAERFQLLLDNPGRTLAEYYALGYTKDDAAWDKMQKYIQLKGKRPVKRKIAS